MPTSEEIKKQLMSMNVPISEDAEEDSGSLWRFRPDPVEEEEAEQEEEEAAPSVEEVKEESEEEEDPLDTFMRVREQREKEKMASLSAEERSARIQYQKQQDQIQRTQFANDFSVDVEVLKERYGDDLVNKAFAKVRRGEAPALVSRRQIETHPNPMELHLRNWTDSPDGIDYITKRYSLQDIKKIVELRNEPWLVNRARDNLLGYNVKPKLKKQTKKQFQEGYDNWLK